jgi:Fungal chitosanase of glycosyl hydrolase group 75
MTLKQYSQEEQRELSVDEYLHDGKWWEIALTRAKKLTQTTVRKRLLIMIGILLTINGNATQAQTESVLTSIPIDKGVPINLKGSDGKAASFEGLQKLLRLSGGQIYIKADMDVDADGSPNAKILDPKYGQLKTSLSFRNVKGQAKYVDAEKVPYFVIAGGPAKFYQKLGVKLGDIAAVVYKGKVAYAIFADVGPKNKMGEGSIALFNALGQSSGVIKDSQGHIKGSKLSKDVVYIVFPGSADGTISPDNVVSKTEQRGKELFTKLGGKP